MLTMHRQDMNEYDPFTMHQHFDMATSIVAAHQLEHCRRVSEGMRYVHAHTVVAVVLVVVDAEVGIMVKAKIFGLAELILGAKMTSAVGSIERYAPTGEHRLVQTMG